MAKPAKIVPMPVPVEEPQEDCPKCPPVGAPAWMATFADIATLLMAFFVLILSFAEFNQPKFKMIAGSLKQSFGVQRQIAVMEQPKGTTVLSLEFSPSPSPSITKELTQQTTDTEKPELEVKQSESDADEGKRELAEALQQALESGQVTVEVVNNEVVMQFAEDAQNAEQLAQQLSEAAEAISQAEQAGHQSTDEILMGGLADDIQKLAEIADSTETGGPAQDDAQGGQKDENELGGSDTRDMQGGQSNQQQIAGQSSEDSQSNANGVNAAEIKASISDAKLRVALRQEVAEGLVEIEQKDDKVFITVGAGGAFPSGSADLTDQAREIIERISLSSMGDASTITVTGHTDDVPVSAGSPFRDNWGLAAARSASVVRELGATGLVDPKRLTAVSQGEAAPVESNDTAYGREQNRRIEIEIDYAE